MMIEASTGKEHKNSPLQLALEWLIDLLYRHTAEIRQHTEQLPAQLAREEMARKGGFDPAQPRAPAGQSDGGQWTDTGGGSGGAAVTPLPRRSPGQLRRKPAMLTAPRPRRKPSRFSREVIERARRINRHAPPGLPPEELEIVPGFDLPRWVLSGAVSRVGSPISDAALLVPAARALRPVASAFEAGMAAARHSFAVPKYLRDARRIPKGVVEKKPGEGFLTAEQSQKLKAFKKRHTKHKPAIQVLYYSDGSAIFSVKQPAGKITGSYAIYERRVSATGENIGLKYKVTVGPKGEFIHAKPY